MEDKTIINSQIKDTAKVFSRVLIKNSSIDEKCLVADNAVIDASNLAEHVEIDRQCYIQNANIGCGSYIRKSSVVKYSNIGNFCSISWNVSIGGTNHDYTCASMYTSYWWKRVFDISFPTKEITPVKIGNDVWIGSGANILSGITIGDGAIIGAGGIVTKDVEPYTIVAGVPSKPIKKRFDDETIAALLIIRWWDWPLECIKKHANLLRSKLTKDILAQLLTVSKQL
jgi:acetyltransferase-like isoleucine patch superfamily enzyme